MLNQFYQEALSKIRANTGDNLYNLSVARGSRGIGKERERVIGAADDLLRSNPALLQETILGINNQAGSQALDLSLGASDLAQRSEMGAANAMIGIGRDLMQERQAKLDRRNALISAVIGGGLSVAGSLGGAWIKNVGTKNLIDSLKDLDPRTAAIVSDFY